MHLFKSDTKIFTSSKVPFFILLFICFASAILGDSIAEALLLSHFDATVIPRMYMVNALFLFLSSLFLMSLIDRIDRGLFFLVFMFVHCAILFLIWCAVSFGITFLFIPLFSYAYVTKIFLFLMFWTLANDIIDSRRAGAEFPFIAAGGTLGAICISFTIPWFLKITSAQNLLIVWVILCVLILLSFLPIRHSFGKYFKQISDSEKHVTRNIKSMMYDVSLISREPLLANMSLLYFLLFFILLNQHYAFYEAIKARFIAAERLAGFLGYFNGVSMGATFLLQITLAGIIIRKIGSTRSMFMLPAVLCIVFGTLVVIGFAGYSGQGSFVAFPILFWGIVGGVGLRIAFFDSFFSPNFQIFFSSLPQDIRGRGKLVIEGVIKPAAMVFASLWLLFITSKMTFSVNMVILFCISVVMIIQTFRIRSSYTESLTQHLGDFKSRVQLSIFDQVEVSHSGDMLSFLSQKLESETYEIRCYIIEILTQINTEESIKILTEYMYKADKKICATIISSLTRLKLDRLKPLFKVMLRDSDNRVVANSIFALAAYNDPEINEGLRAFLQHENNRVNANTVIALWPVSDGVRKKILLTVLKEMLDSEKTEICSSALYALQEVKLTKDTGFLLISFCRNRKETILSDRAVWHHFLRAVGKNPAEELIEILLQLANSVSKKMKSDIISSITKACINSYPVENLITGLDSNDVISRGIILKVISNTNPLLSKETEQLLINVAQEEAVLAYDCWLGYKTLMKDRNNTALQLLANVIFEECLVGHLNNLISVAAILDQSGQVKKVMRRLNHENRHVRARALEVLDNVGNLKVNRMVIKLIDTCDKAKDIKEITESPSHEQENISSLLTTYTEDPNRWVSECSRYALAQFNA